MRIQYSICDPPMVNGKGHIQIFKLRSDTVFSIRIIRAHVRFLLRSAYSGQGTSSPKALSTNIPFVNVESRLTCSDIKICEEGNRNAKAKLLRENK